MGELEKSSSLIFIKEEKIKVIEFIYPQKCGICGKLNKKSLCKKCEMQLKQFTQIKIEKIEHKNFSELIYIFKYEGLIRKLILDYKFNEKSYLYESIVNFILKQEKIFEKIKNYDTIIPVPISKKRMKERGYNQSFLIAKKIKEQMKENIRICNNCLIKTKNIIEQSKLTMEEREVNIKDVYELQNVELIKNKKILLIDDIYTTGSTVNECCKTLKQGSPKQIGVLVVAKD